MNTTAICYRLSVTGGKERMRFHARENDPKFLEGLDVHSKIATLHKSKNAHYKALVKAGAIKLREGVVRLIDEARKEGILLAIATTTSIENVESLVESQLGKHALAWFSVIAAGLKSIVIVNDYTKDDDLGAAALLVDSLGEPDEPIRVIQGTMDETYITVDTARALLESS